MAIQVPDRTPGSSSTFELLNSVICSMHALKGGEACCRSSPISLHEKGILARHWTGRGKAGFREHPDSLLSPEAGSAFATSKIGSIRSLGPPRVHLDVRFVAPRSWVASSPVTRAAELTRCEQATVAWIGVNDHRLHKRMT